MLPNDQALREVFIEGDLLRHGRPSIVSVNMGTVSRLVLHDNLAELKRLAAWIEGWAGQVSSPDVLFAIQLCLEEAVANIIMYGGDRLNIAIELERDGRTLITRIEDNGRHFDPTQFPPPWTANSLEETKIGDLGIHLVRSFASDMHYERQEGRNRLTLRFAEPH
jgi:serine/threonine-protein kinase RsbW